MAIKKVKVGVVGCGKIAPAYGRGMAEWDILEVAACADLHRPAAEKFAADFQIPRVLTVEELLADPEIEIVVNLTIPAAHSAVNLQAIAAGKHVYVEKPLALTREEGKEVLAAAKKARVLVACAPDTILGSGHQLCRALLEEGAIGQPVAATAFMVGRGHEHWHPSPEFYYAPGGGPLFDMGPYYLTAMVTLFGPVVRVTAVHRTHFARRPILSEPKKGQIIDVQVPTHLTGLLEFANGATATTIFSFDVFGGHHLPRLEFHGTEGSLAAPDPNGFDGAVSLKRRDDKDWTEVPQRHTHKGQRGLGVADLAYSVRRRKRPHRAHGALALHVLDIMCAFHDSARAGKAVTLRTACEVAPMIPVGLPARLLDK